MPRLFVLSGVDIGRVIDVADGAVLGRSQDVAVPLRSKSISRRHARITSENGRWFVEDLGSRNGVRVDGQQVPRAELADGTVFVLGKLELRFRLAESEAPAAAPPPAAPRAAPPQEPAAPDPRDPKDVETGLGEIELEGDWSDDPPPSAPAPRVTPGAAQPPAQPKRAVEAKTAVDAKTAARAAALGGARPAERATHSGKRILQYQRYDDGGSRFLGADLSQQPLPVRLLAYFLALALFAALGYGAFKLTAKLRQQADAGGFVEEQ